MNLPIGRSLGMFTGNLSQPLIAVILLRPLVRVEEMLGTLKGITAFLLIAAIGAPAIAALISAATLSATGWIADPVMHWRIWFVTNVLSTVVLAPPLLTALRWRSLPRPFGPPFAEFLILLTCLTASERLVNSIASSPITVSPLMFAPLPFFLWAAVRFGSAGLGIVLCFTTLFRYFADVHLGQGITPPADAVVVTQLTLIAMALPLIVLSALLSERRTAEEALRNGHTRYGLAMFAGSVGVWDWNLVSNDIYVDPSLKQLLGYADREIHNHFDQWSLRVHADDVTRVMETAQAHIEGRTPTFEVTHRMLHKDGTIRWFLARGAVVDWDAGKAVRMIGTATDITAQKDTEWALEEAKAELTRLTRLSDMGGLTAAIAHEVNQPLCAIVANASAALRWLGSDRPESAAGARGADRRRLRRETRERADSPDARPVRTRRAAAPSRRLEQRDRQRAGADAGLARFEQGHRADRARCLAAARAGRPRADAAGDVATRIWCMLSRRNAHARQGEMVLQICTVFEAGSGIHAIVIYCGEGFDGEDPERVFRPLVTTRPEGMGIGLSMSRIIVEMHGGRLWATPKAASWPATSHVTLPLEAHA